MRYRAPTSHGIGTLTLFWSLVACAPAHRNPPPVTPQRDSLTEKGPSKEHDQRSIPAPPPAYGHRVVLRDLRSESSPTADTRSEVVSEPEQERTCVDFWPETRHRNYGYDHIVHLLSRCDVPAFCVVSSDVNPRGALVEIRPREYIEVVTFRGSPAREFKPEVECRFLV